MGSVLVGPADFIERAKRLRKVTGGGMRQAGCIANAALHALDNNFPKMAEDHRRVRIVYEALKSIPQIQLPSHVDTNILYFEVEEGPKLVAALQHQGFMLGSYGPRRVRLTTHCNITDESIAGVIAAIQKYYSSE